VTSGFELWVGRVGPADTGLGLRGEPQSDFLIVWMESVVRFAPGERGQPQDNSKTRSDNAIEWRPPTMKSTPL